MGPQALPLLRPASFPRLGQRCQASMNQAVNQDLTRRAKTLAISSEETEHFSPVRDPPNLAQRSLSSWCLLDLPLIKAPIVLLLESLSDFTKQGPALWRR